MLNLAHDELLQKIESIANIGHWYVDLLADSVYWSDEIYNIHGVDKNTYTPDIASAIEFYHPEERNNVTLLISNAIEKGEDFSFEHRLLRPDGEERFVRSMGECRKDKSGKVIGLFGLFLDITDFKKTQRQLQSSNDFMNLILESIPDYVLIKDENFVIRKANKQFMSLYPPEKRDKVIGYTTIEEYSTDEANAFLEEDRKALEKGYSEKEETITFPDGDIRTLFTKKVRFYNEDDAPFILGIARDITNRKTMEITLRESNKQLEEFAYIASHDMKAPLRHITSCLDILKTKYAEHLPNEAAEVMDIMDNASAKMQQMLDDLLNLATIDGSDKSKGSLDLNDVIHDALESLSATAGDKNAHITVNLPEQTPIWGHKGVLTQCVQNLVDNALKYTPQGQPPEIDITVKPIRELFEIRIADKGIGIDPKYQKRIFQMFKRLHGEDSEYEGSGIGLALCRQIVQAHNGSIHLDEHYTNGSCFVITLPQLLQSGITE